MTERIGVCSIAKKEGRCNITGIESKRKTKNSNHKRSYKSIGFNTTLENNIYLRESIQINIFTQHLTIGNGGDLYQSL